MVLTIEIEDTLWGELELATKKEKLSSEKLVTKALRDFLYLKRVSTLRKKLENKAKTAGFSTEDAIFKAVS